MDVFVANIPPKFGVLLSRSWTSKLKGSLQMDMSYATIPMDGGSKRLYNEKISPYVVRSQYKPDDHAIYDVDTNWDIQFSLMMFLPMIFKFLHLLKGRRMKSLQRNKTL